MSIVKVIEVIAESPKGWDDAANQAVNEVSKTVKGVTEVWVSSMKAIVENDRVVRYRITANVSFVVKGHETVDACVVTKLCHAPPVGTRFGSR